MTARRTVAVAGSCATRDNFSSNFNPDHQRWYDLVATNNQSSLIALMSPPVEPEIAETDGLNEHQEWTIRSDFSRVFLDDLARTRPDYLLVDFSGDTAFGVLRLPDGRYVTDNHWKVGKTAWYQRAVAAGATRLSWREDEAAYRLLWDEALARFAAYVGEHCPDTQVIVHRLRSVRTLVRGETDRPTGLRRGANLLPLDVRSTNRYRTALDDHATTACGWEQIDLRAERYSSPADHPWGPYYVHYTRDYNRRFLAELHRHDLTRRLDAATSERIAVVADAGHERLVAQARHLRRTDVAQREQIRALSGLGPLRAAARAVARRRAAEGSS
ncbi:MAG: DUF6270 domain-containing protein [Marmoricola sp.]